MASIKLKNVRIAFIDDLRHAAQFDGQGAFRYSATFLVQPGSENDKIVNAAINEAAADAWGKKAEAMLAGFRGNVNKFCYIDGNTKPDYEGFEDMFYLSSHRKQDDGRPLLLDMYADPATGKPARLIDQSTGEWLPGKEGRIYAGCYVNATIDIYAQTKNYPGIRASLKGVQFAGDGDSFSGARRASDDEFDAVAPADTEDELG
uniref:ssDNA-binding protein n=1 Tax=Burkholderia anthina TaxID=179879 RepID=UPI00158C1185|nr:ssDNA-binding protein [Burkholderia anthina]